MKIKEKKRRKKEFNVYGFVTSRDKPARTITSMHLEMLKLKKTLCSLNISSYSWFIF